MIAVTASRLGNEEGGVLVTVAIFMTVMILFAAFVIDIGNWFEHQRHLQAQVDAGVFAAAQEFRFPCTDSSIVTQAQNYSGTQYNAQVSGAQGRVHMLVNSPTYYNQTKGDSDPNTGSPCADEAIDLKGTETDVPWFIKAAGIVPFINAHARAEIRQSNALGGIIPVSVPNPDPKAIKVTFFDETQSGRVLGSATLTKGISANGLTQWSNAGAPLPITVDTPEIGMRITLSGSSSTTCGDPLVTCYDQTEFIHGWVDSDISAGGAPKIRDANLVNGGCSDPYFSYTSGGCSVGINASIKLPPQVTANDMDVSWRIVGSNQSQPLTFDTGSGKWISPANSALSVGAAAGPVPFQIDWKVKKDGVSVGSNACRAANNTPCTGTFSRVQRSFGAGDAVAGPVRLAQLSENGAIWGPNSAQECTSTFTDCIHNIVVTLGIEGSLRNATSVNEPLVALRVVGGSQNQSLDCDPAQSNLRDELQLGCAPAYTKNTGTSCPQNATALWGSAQPWPCVAVQTGSSIGQIGDGLNARVYGSKSGTCSATTGVNNWTSFVNPGLPDGDPRIVELILTPFGAFSGSGSTTVPVQDFGTFYLMGWDGDTCSSDPAAPKGFVVGHFIKYIQKTNNGGGGSALCDFTAFGTCVAVLTR